MESKEEAKTFENVRIVRRRRDTWYDLKEEPTNNPYESPRAGAHPVDVYYIPQSLLVGPSEEDLQIDMDAEIQAHEEERVRESAESAYEEEMRRQRVESPLSPEIQLPPPPPVVTPEDKPQVHVITPEDKPQVPRAEPEYILLSPCTPPPTPPSSPVRPASPTPPFDNDPSLLEHIEGAPITAASTSKRYVKLAGVYDIRRYDDLDVSAPDPHADVRFYDDEDSDDVSLGSKDSYGWWHDKKRRYVGRKKVYSDLPFRRSSRKRKPIYRLLYSDLSFKKRRSSRKRKPICMSLHKRKPSCK